MAMAKQVLPTLGNPESLDEEDAVLLRIQACLGPIKEFAVAMRKEEGVLSATQITGNTAELNSHNFWESERARAMAFIGLNQKVVSRAALWMGFAKEYSERSANWLSFLQLMYKHILVDTKVYGVQICFIIV